MNRNDTLYTKEKDGTIQKWYFSAWSENQFSVSTVKNAKFKDYKKYFNIDDIGKIIFLTRKEAREANIRADGHKLR